MLVKSFLKIDFKQYAVVGVFFGNDRKIIDHLNVFKRTRLAAIPTFVDDVILEDIGRKNLHEIGIFKRGFPLGIEYERIFKAVLVDLTVCHYLSILNK